MRMALLIGVIALMILLAAWLWPRGWEPWQLPDDIPRPAVPADNPMNAAKVELGRWLFHDRRLSADSSMSCATCHQQALAFTDGRQVAVGIHGDLHPRNAMSLANVAYVSRLTWAHPLLDRLEDQALIPLFGDDPVEMGLGGNEQRIAELLRAEPHYSELANEAFPHDEDPHSILNGVRAIAAFVRSIVSFDTAYDRYLAGDDTAMSAAAVRGMELFFSERTECFHCHGGFNFSDSSTHENSRIDTFGFHNNGLYNLAGEGRYPADNTGLFDHSGERRDMGRFRAPTLRNIALTAPYMHDGSIATLPEVLAHYERGGRLIEKGATAGDGRLNPYKSPFVVGFQLTPAERADLLAFLRALSDLSLLTNPRFSDPFRETEAAP